MFSIAREYASTTASMAPFVAAGIFYYVFNMVVAVTMNKLEKRVSKYQI